MDTGIVGFFALLAALLAGLIWVVRHRRRAESVLIDAGFVPTAEIPGFLAAALEATFGSDGSAVWHRSDNSWAIDLLLDAGDESPGSRIALCARTREATSEMVVLSYVGAGPSSWLGRVGLRLVEAGEPDLAKRHRLTDESRGLILENRGFVVWSSEPGDVSELIPPAAVKALRSARGVEGLALTAGALIVWSPWSALEVLLQAFGELRNAFGPSPTR